MSARTLPILLLALLALPALAQVQDFHVDLNAPERQATLSALLVVQANWDLPAEDQSVVVELEVPAGEIGEVNRYNPTSVCESKLHSVRCTVAAGPSLFGGLAVSVRFPAAGTYTATARLIPSTPDSNPANDSDTQTIYVAGLPSLQTYGVADLPEGSSIDPGGPGQLRIGVQNDGEPATNVTLRASLPEGGRFTGVALGGESFCSVVSDTEAVCRFDEVRPIGGGQFVFNFIAPDRTGGGTFPFVVAVDASQDDFDPDDDVDEGDVRLRVLMAVTNAADDGPGSLRQAILDARVACEDVPCLIGIRSSEPLVIQPHSPLPALRGRVKVDGGAMKSILDGSLLQSGDGLHYEDGCEIRIDRMIIHNFPGHAIEAHQAAYPPGTRCGTDSLLTPLYVTNSELIGNLRGVVTKDISATITHNVIREQRRAGIFADGGYFTEIAHNEIANNGASGIFVNPSLSGASWLPAGAEIFDNVVRGNGEWGICRASHGAVSIVRNAVSGNNLYGIDYGLDLATPNAPNKPVLTSATYDPVRNVTVIRGSMTPVQTYFGSSVDLYASSSLSRWGYPEAERWIAEVHRTGEFEAVVAGDLRGQWITATGTRVVDVFFLRAEEEVVSHATFRYAASDTSELSDAVRVGEADNRSSRSTRAITP
ncbi:MAG: right-handed parallel beta-helix repeat-containing protein [Acidobacteriota bacterium]